LRAETAQRYLEIWHGIEDYAANPMLPISVDRLWRQSGVSQRTLYSVCRAISGQSPLTYIRHRRMILARGMLQRAGGTAEVTKIATFCGFHQFGQFAHDYRQLFGGLPSQTLRTGPHARHASPHYDAELHRSVSP
jgi:transcriptional regulator GlxA family with amidase domain